jgi:CRISPR/Cas system-associated exonuclease Cas4 (RecB family)
MIVEKVLEAKTRKVKQYPVNSNRASELGHECLRYLVLNRTRWQEKTLHDARLQMIFDMGRAVEDLVYQDLREAGFVIVEQQRPFSWAKYQITGSIDFKLSIDGQVYPVEVKSAAPGVFASINSIADMLHHKYPYMRKYPAQLTLYLLMDNKERGLFLFKNKSTGELKEIWMDLDYNFAESLVQKAEAINKHVAEGTLPEPMEYKEDICGECPFIHICLPDRIGKEVEVTEDSELLELANRYFELKPGAKEFDEVNERINKLVEGREKILVGDYFIEGKWVDKPKYDIPPEVRDKYKVPGQCWRKNIMKV